jgi:hypothetical protein
VHRTPRHTRAVRHRSLTLLATVLLIWSSACTDRGHRRGADAAASGNPVITPDEARALVRGFWPRREAAFAAADVAAIQRLETGAAVLADVGVLQDVAGRMPSPSIARVRDHGQIGVWVPRQEVFPAVFLAAVNTETHEDRAARQMLLVFSKGRRGARWRLAQYGVWGRASIDEDARRGDSFSAPPPVIEGLRPGALPSELAAFWQACWDTGDVPSSRFLPGYWTTQRCELIAGSRPGEFSPACGCIPSLRYRPYPNAEQYAFTFRSGLLACFAIEIEDVSTARPGRALFQDRNRNNWGGLLAAGWYREIVKIDLRQVCVVGGPHDARMMQVIGDNGDYATVRVRARPAGSEGAPRLAGAAEMSAPST